MNKSNLDFSMFVNCGPELLKLVNERDNNISRITLLIMEIEIK